MAAELSRRERAARALEHGPWGQWLRRLGTWRGLLVLNYHHVARGAGELHDSDTWSATPEDLDRQLALIIRHFDVVGPEELLRPPSRVRARVLLTFDDGYRNNHDLALPVLARHGVPAVFFICTGFIDRPRLPWWEQLAEMVRGATVERLPPMPGLPNGLPVAGIPATVTVNRLRPLFEPLDEERARERRAELGAALGHSPDERARPDVWMTWDMIRSLRDAGMSIGGHSMDHPRLSVLDPDAQRRQIAGSLDRIEQETGERPVLFSYPYGRPDCFDTTTKQAARSAGVRLAFSYYGGYNRRSTWDPLDVRRVSVTAAASQQAFRASLAAPRLFARW